MWKPTPVMEEVSHHSQTIPTSIIAAATAIPQQTILLCTVVPAQTVAVLVRSLILMETSSHQTIRAMKLIVIAAQVAMQVAFVSSQNHAFLTPDTAEAITAIPQQVFTHVTSQMKMESFSMLDLHSFPVSKLSCVST